MFQFVAAIVYGFSFSEHYLHFRWGVSVGSSNGVMMRYVLVVRCLSHSKGRGEGNMHMHSGKLNGSTLFTIYNMHYVNFRIQV